MIWKRRITVKITSNFFLWITICLLFSNFHLNKKAYASNNLEIQKLIEIPEWIQTQISDDLTYFKDKPISLKHLDEYFHEHAAANLLVKFTVIDNQIYIEDNLNEKLKPRYSALHNALIKLSKIKPLPNVCFLYSVHDGISLDSEDIPIFTMSTIKNENSHHLLIPDYEALREHYQVLKDVDILKSNFPWDQKIPQIMWRGSTCQYSWKDPNDRFIRENTIDFFSRANLCQLSEKYPHLIDAKFTIFVLGAENVPSLQKYRGQWIRFEEQVKYKYQIFIDGNVVPFSNSVWKFLIHSLIFKVDSPWVQWYFQGLKPYTHYIPVKSNLDDLIEKLTWAMDHDSEAQMIANNMTTFVCQRVTSSNNLAYIYHLIHEYSQLQFTE